MSEDFNDLPDLDDLFSGEDFDEPLADPEVINILFIGRRKLFDTFLATVGADPFTNFVYTKTVEDAIDHLLVDIFAIVMLDNEDPDMDLITISRIVRVNHPLARIVALSSSRRSLFIADIINHGAVDAYLPLPAQDHELLTIMTEQQAKHEIDKMLTTFVSDPPLMSAASYLLLDPSLSAREDEPVKFVGIMVAYKSVPRYSQYFEDLLAKDEILFAGYLSGITMLGQELLKSADPLKEINFGGISVIFRFYDDLQYSIFVRNLSKHNVGKAEEVITDILGELMSAHENILASTDRPTDEELVGMEAICNRFDNVNEQVIYEHETKDQGQVFKGQEVLIYGTDNKEHQKIMNYLDSKVEFRITTTSKEEEAKDFFRNTEIAVLVIDSDLNNYAVQSPLDFADFVKDEYPFTQVIYQMRDRRASSPIIRSLNSGAINYLISYRSTRKELRDWIEKGIEKSLEIRAQSESSEAGGLDAAIIAKTMIRSNAQSYLTDSTPVLGGLFISKAETPIFKRFWEPSVAELDEHMLAGLVASLESVGGEMFYDDSSIGGLELGDSNILVEHRDEFNVVFFIKNLASHNVIMIKQDLENFTDKLWELVSGAEVHQDEEFASRLDTLSNKILSDFSEKYTETE
ncbi:MAG: hypothetical protein ACXAE3_16110 [Candidatus Kariarchaeaceae archaeon]|jgi:DNA-binding NarL/FixJ family response regulator